MLHIERFVVNPFQENTYIVFDDTLEAVIIDCGVFFKEERKALVNYIREKNLKVIHLLSTHGHIDHNFGNNTISDEFGVKPEVHQADAPLMDCLKRQSEEYINFPLDYDMPAVGKYLTEEDVITFGTHRFTAIHTPGHTPGSVLFHCEEEKLAFSGDTLFRMSIGRTDLMLGSYSDMMASLKKIAVCLPEDTTIIPGHGPQTTLREEVAMNPYFS